MKDYLVGMDIGGTKTGVAIGTRSGRLIASARFPTTPERGVDRVLARFKIVVDELLQKQGIALAEVEAVGIACGGPLDRASGRLFAPPNLAVWGEAPVVELVEERLGVKAYLENDANAGALAEWKFGAARGLKNVIFLTFGTGLGAGLILDGRLYRGASDLAGEAGHIRLADDGPLGYGKNGSFEGFCSGGGLPGLARMIAAGEAKNGRSAGSSPWEQDLEHLAAHDIVSAAKAGDPAAQKVMSISARYLGRGISILIDLLNPEAVVIGSIFARAESLLRPGMEEEIKAEALELAASKCKVLPALLGEELGYYASLSVAMEALGEF
ncbi:MAG: ROK family protein [Firmicutes bacterium]|nr:ROK family protein [Bacillota bacterium]